MGNDCTAVPSSGSLDVRSRTQKESLVIQRQTLEAIREPVVLAEIVLNLSTESFLALYADSKVDERHFLDRAEVFSAILHRGDAGKKLVLARYARLGGGWSGLGKPEDTLALSKISLAHKCALLANSRADWYFPSGFGADPITETLLVPTLCGDDAAAEAFLSNPRANRALIATAIRAKPPFDGLDLGSRLRIGFGAVRAQYIDSPNFPGKDSPDSNELDYDKPNAAFLAALKELWESGPQQDSQAAQFFYDLHEPTIRAGTLTSSRLAVDPDDWLLQVDRAAVEAVGDVFPRYRLRSALAGRRLAEWAARLGKSAPLAPAEAQQMYDFDGGVGNLSVLLALKGLQLSSGAGDVEWLAAWISSSGWTGSAAATAFACERQFESGPFSKRSERAVEFVSGQTAHAAAAIRGLAVSAAFRRLAGSNDGVRAAFKDLASGSDEARRAFDYVDSLFPRLFSRGLDDSEAQEAADRAAEAKGAREAEEVTAASRVFEPVREHLLRVEGKVSSLQVWMFWGFVILAAILAFR